MARRKRRTSEGMRTDAIIVARRLLLEEGPAAITLKAISSELGVSNDTLLDQFGSPSGLVAALAAEMAMRVTIEIGAVAQRFRAGETNQREVVDHVFDAFDGEGVGRLLSWILLSGDGAALEPVLRRLHELVTDLAGDDPSLPVAEATAFLISTAVGDALIGARIAETLSLRRDSTREIATNQVIAFYAGARPPAAG